jgi:hypothetical protein
LSTYEDIEKATADNGQVKEQQYRSGRTLVW